jgi:23S rRNA (guanosine2251-2'-O)-methyltransferase
MLAEARRRGIPVTHLPRRLLSRKLGRGATHQGIAAQVAPVAHAEVGGLCRSAAEREAGLLVPVDRVTDPGNLGSILRTAAAAAADGVILASEGTVGLSPAVAKSSAGAVERVPVARERRPARRVEWLKAHGFTALVLDPRGRESWDRVDLAGPLVVVAGGEEQGPRRGLAAACNLRVAIPLATGVDSLNVAISVGVLLFEAVRQRRRPDGRP